MLKPVEVCSVRVPDTNHALQLCGTLTVCGQLTCVMFRALTTSPLS